MLVIFKTLFVILMALLAFSVIAIAIFMQHPLFGKNPSGERLKKIKQSPHYQNGQFQNMIPKPLISEGHSLIKEVYKTFITQPERQTPSQPLPSIKTDLKTLPDDHLIWFGHSSMFLKLNGRTFLIDPVMSGSASPISNMTKAYAGTDIYTVDDLPEIDYLLISHDHYDHLDYKTIVVLQDKVKHVVTGLGVGEHFEYWGYSKQKLIERDWFEHIDLDNQLRIYFEPSHHNSGRRYTNSKNLWVSFVIQSPDLKIFYTGDGGYDDRFKEIGQRHGGLDWALMENGQYNIAWRSVHCLPDEVAQATEDLHAKNMLPVHHSKFTLAQHAWDEPIRKISKYSTGRNYRLATPMIGEAINLKSQTQNFQKWWEDID
jgi:L-ascorbate metabolism protein UlaG (beta-lactamase superfamily)